MSFLLKKEIQGLAGDIKAKEYALEADKYTFERKLLNGMGKQMIEKLNNPDKPNYKLAWKLKIARWFKQIKEKWTNRTTIDCGDF